MTEDGGAKHITVGATVAATYRTLFGNRWPELARCLRFPLLISFVIYALEIAIYESLSTWSPWQGWLYTYGPGFLDLVPYTLFAVAWHRALLLDEASRQPVLSWSKSHWRFLAYAVVFNAAIDFSLNGLAGISLTRDISNDALRIYLSFLFPVAVLCWFVLLLGLWLRLALVYPASAIDQDTDLAGSWVRTRGQGRRLLGGYLLASSPIVLLSYLVQAHSSSFLLDIFTLHQDGDDAAIANLVSYFVDLLHFLVDYLFVIISVTYVSLCFRRLVLEEDR